MKRKALFFDIDGTLLSEITHRVPESAVKAIQLAREKGHLVFINSGRTWSHIGMIKELIETDGYLCGCGTYIKAGSEVLYSYQIPLGRGNEIKEKMREYKIEGILESADCCYMSRQPYRNKQAEQIRGSLSDSQALADMDDDTVRYDKFCIWTDELSDSEKFFESIKTDIQIIDRGGDFFECVPKGHSKATAISLVLKHYRIELEQAYVFGDSNNDLPMFEFAKNAILMGEHDKELESYASMITKTVEDDGIAFAMKKLGII